MSQLSTTLNLGTESSQATSSILNPDIPIKLTNLTSTLLNPLENLSVQPFKLATSHHAPKTNSISPFTSLNETHVKSPTAIQNDPTSLNEPPLFNHPSLHIPTKDNSPSPRSSTSLASGSISIDLQLYNPGPKATIEDKAQNKSHKAPSTSLSPTPNSPTSPTAITAFSNFSSFFDKKSSLKHSAHTRSSL